MTEKHHKSEDEDTAIDFSKIKNWFKKDKKESKHTEHHHQEKSGEDDSIDYKSTMDFFKKYSIILLVLIPVIITIYLRMQPMFLPVTDSWSQNAVYNYYKGQIATQISQQYPNLPDANKQTLLDTEFNKFLTQNKDLVNQQIAGTSQQFKDKMMYESGNSKYVYLGDIDSYFWLREARKLINTGYNCDEIDFENKLCYVDTYTMAPIKSAVPLGTETASPYSYSIVYVYKVFKTFSPDITLMQASFYVQIIYGVLAAILAFLIGNAIAGNFAGFLTSVIISVNPIALSRTLGSDNDPLSLFFPLLTVLFFIYTAESKDWTRRIIFGALTGLAIGVYSWAWQGWWFIFIFVFATSIIFTGFYLLRHILKHKNIVGSFKHSTTKNNLATIAILFFSSAFFITIISGFSTFLNFVKSPFWFMQTKVAALQSYWPNVLVTVAEFNPGSISTIIGQMGGKLIFFLGLMGILFIITIKQEKIEKEQKYLLAFGALVYLLLVSDYGTKLSPIIYMTLLALPVVISMLVMLKSEKEVDVKLAILLVIWFIATTYASLKGVRFTLLMSTAFGVSFAITLAAIYKLASKWISTELKINETLTKSIIVILLLFVLISPVKAGYSLSQSYTPSVNDAWYDSLTKIKDNSKPDAIINSWWDFGHWFKYLADRRVTLDGSSQSGPPLHWLGKLMVTQDEKQSVGILRMLDCGSNTAFDKLNGVVNDTSRSISILDNIVTQEKEDARATLLENGLTKKDAAIILNYTHCNPPEDFFITSEDMVGKAGVWAHFGSWDFTRAEMYTRVKGLNLEEGRKILTNKEYNLTPEQADQYYYEIQTQDDSQWIATWPGYMSAVQPCDTPNAEGIMTCNQQLSNGQQIPFIINLTDMDVTVPAKEDYKPTSIVFVTDNATQEKKFSGNTLPFSVVLVPQDNGYSVIVTHPSLANSIFTRLFYLNGHGLEYFDKFDDQTGINSGRIIVWKVDWEGKDANMGYQKAQNENEPLNNQTVNATKVNSTTKKTANSSNE